MNLVLDEKIDQRHQRAKECASQILPIPDCLRIGRAQCHDSQSPWDGGDQIADHENIVPTVIIRARDICPASTRQGPEDAHAGHKFGQSRIRLVAHAVDQEDHDEARARADGDEELEDRSLGVAIANGRGYGGKPFDGVAEVLVLNNLFVVEADSDDEGA